jgi:hypothetical protein
MADLNRIISELRREHPIFFWGVLATLVLLLSASTVIGIRIPQYRQQAAELDAKMTEAERETRDRILDSRTRRSQLAIALLQRELRLKSLEEEGLHLAISLEDSTLALRHGAATLREVPVQIGPDSVVRAPDGRTWRFVRALGERHLDERQRSPEYLVPEWIYVSRGQPVPPEAERRIEGGLGDYVLRLDDGTEIYTLPEAGPLADRVKPASFVLTEEDMRAIFDAVKVDTPVYIY